MERFLLKSLKQEIMYNKANAHNHALGLLLNRSQCFDLISTDCLDEWIQMSGLQMFTIQIIKNIQGLSKIKPHIKVIFDLMTTLL